MPLLLFDIVSEIDMQEVRNAVENATDPAPADFRNVLRPALS